MSPAHRARQHRWRVLVFVVVVIVGVAVAASTHPASAPPAQASPAALVSAPDAESSAWYCTGQGTASSVVPGQVFLTNTTAHAISGTITTITDAGATAKTAVAVPPDSVVAPPQPSAAGSWAGQVVTLDGGGVAVTQSVQYSGSWSVVPCQSSTASTWYFPSGSTSSGSGLQIVLLNPTSTPVVVDFTFVTPNGVIHPITYQGVVIQPGQLVAMNVAPVVQNESAVSSIVAARTGRFIATEIQAFPAPTAGVSLLPGIAVPQSHFVIPQAEEVQGGSSEIDVFNPGQTAESVTVRLRLGSGPLAPLSSTVAPFSTWVLTTSTQTRIPVGESYSADIEATGGSGVVVGRAVHAPATATAPQSGLADAVDGRSTASPTGQWVVAPPGTSAAPAVSGAAPQFLALTNTSSTDEDYRAFALSPSGERPLASGTIAAHGTVVVSGSALAAGGLDQIMVRATGPMAVSEDAAPSGSVGVVTIPGLPLGARINGL